VSLLFLTVVVAVLVLMIYMAVKSPRAKQLLDLDNCQCEMCETHAWVAPTSTQGKDEKAHLVPARLTDRLDAIPVLPKTQASTAQ